MASILNSGNNFTETDPNRRLSSVGPTELQNMQCPYCDKNLAFVHLIIDTYPYIHVDLRLHYVFCKTNFLFGIPFDPIAGMTKMIFAENNGEAVNAFLKTKAPQCPFHNREMMATKYFGKPISKEPKLQFKCPECFFIRHIPIEHRIPEYE